MNQLMNEIEKRYEMAQMYCDNAGRLYSVIATENLSDKKEAYSAYCCIHDMSNAARVNRSAAKLASKSGNALANYSFAANHINISITNVLHALIQIVDKVAPAYDQPSLEDWQAYQRNTALPRARRR